MAESGRIGGVTMEEYISALRRQGTRATPGCPGTCWQRSETLAMERTPPFCLDVPAKEEIRVLLRRTRSLVASYVRPADAEHPPNAWLYLCQNRDYHLDVLAATARRDARRALRAFRLDFLDSSQFLQHGVVPFCETRARVGLSDGTPELFHNYARRLVQNPAYKIVGAWRGDCLAAYLWMMLVDDWAAIGAYAADEHLRYCPNNGLIDFALDYCLTQRRCCRVSYGLSSLQETSNALTLDYFKKRVGFEARPVHRAFAFHPVLRPLINSSTQWMLKHGARLFPRSRMVRKAAGLLNTYLGWHHPPRDGVDPRPEETEDRPSSGRQGETP
ncbi:MAG: hypothetical protein ABSG68_20580 [Thermoguttaceae bacterium]|jgi:hypothetical protein